MRSFNKIFCIGLSRTGTKSITEALRILGVNVKHYPSSEQALEMITRGRFDIPELRDYRGISDVMAAAYFHQFDVAHPNSLFILTKRSSTADWLESTKKKIKDTSADRIDISIFLRLAVYGIPCWNKLQFEHTYNNHITRIRNYFKNRKSDLLEIDICKGEGWKELCSFLNCQEPKIEFPNLKEQISAERKWESRIDDLKYRVEKVLEIKEDLERDLNQAKQTLASFKKNE